ncbi:MAG: DUF429 domain-containing protein [Candidatus Micrarchaeota archaeon]|nr:DUF429 domain-containing protein [Candidatus Micrarchaeota archaeon]
MDFLSLDLAGSPKRPTGYAYLEDGILKTGHVYGDKEILDLASSFSRVGMDAPLSLPRGRESLEKPSKEHFRECDLMLRQRAIKFFPITLGPMRKLTARGIALKEKLSNVVELFPGASYDMLGLERKDIKALEGFLEPFSPRLKSQHEADAAVGWFTLWQEHYGEGELLKGEDGAILIAKPALYLGPKVEAEFLERENRFVVKTSVGKAYLRDTAKLSHLLQPGTKLYLTPYQGRFAHMVKAAWDGKRWVMLDSHLDNRLFELYMRSQGKKVKKAKKQNNIIFDFEGYEIKGAHLFHNDVALFPDTFSARAKKHFLHLKGEVVFVAHAQACCVSINPQYKELERILPKAWGISTRIIGNYWVTQRAIPYRFIKDMGKTKL